MMMMKRAVVFVSKNKTICIQNIVAAAVSASSADCGVT